MKRKFMYIRLLLVFTFSIISNQVYPIDSLIVDKDNYKLVYIGNESSISDLKSKYWAGYTFVNVHMDSSFYKSGYPVPRDPPMVKQQFLYQLKNSSSVTIKIIDSNDSLYFNFSIDDQTPGYYYFIFYYSKFPSIDHKVLSSLQDIRIVFLIEEKRFSFPLRNIN